MVPGTTVAVSILDRRSSARHRQEREQYAQSRTGVFNSYLSTLSFHVALVIPEIDITDLDVFLSENASMKLLNV